jgi:hypothetical protein
VEACYIKNHPRFSVGRNGGGERRVRDHLRQEYRLLEQWVGLVHGQAKDVEKSVKDAWVAAGWGPVAGGPTDGCAETAEPTHLKAAGARARILLGDPS